MKSAGRERLLTLTCLLWGLALLCYMLGLRLYLIPTGCALVALIGYVIERFIMFGRDKPKAPVAATSEPAQTVLAAEATFTGNLQLQGQLLVFGRLVGNVTMTEGRVRVMQGGCIEGEVHAPEVELNGVLEGTCEATSVAILAHGRLQGICRGGTLSIQPGGVFLGHSQALGETHSNVTPLAGGKGKEPKESKKSEPAPEAKEA